MNEQIQPVEPAQQGKPTELATIVVCQCKSTNFVKTKTTKTAVVLECRNCGMKTSVQGWAAMSVRVPSSEMQYALFTNVVSPAPPPPPSEPETEEEETGEPVTKYENFRFRVTADQRKVVRRALEAIRIENHHADEYRAQTWQGHAIEYLSAEFIAGRDPKVLAIIDAQENAVEQLAQEAEGAGKKWSKRKETKLRNDTREALIAKYGLDKRQEQLFKPETDGAVENALKFEQQRREEREEDAEDSRILDDGMLKKSLIAARDECNLQNLMLIDSLEKVNSHADEDGGYVLRVTGDHRTKTASGRTVEEFVWLDSDCVVNGELDFLVPYLDQIDDIIPDASLRVTELLPKNWDSIDEDEKWEQPYIADTREVLK